MAAFYALPECLFYSFADAACRDRYLGFRRHRRQYRVRSEVEKIVDGMPEILFAAEISFSGLDRCVPEQKLNLLRKRSRPRPHCQPTSEPAFSAGLTGSYQSQNQSF